MQLVGRAVPVVVSQGSFREAGCFKHMLLTRRQLLALLPSSLPTALCPSLQS